MTCSSCLSISFAWEEKLVGFLCWNFNLWEMKCCKKVSKISPWKAENRENKENNRKIQIHHQIIKNNKISKISPKSNNHFALPFPRWFLGYRKIQSNKQTKKTQSLIASFSSTQYNSVEFSFLNGVAYTCDYGEVLLQYCCDRGTLLLWTVRFFREGGTRKIPRSLWIFAPAK